MEDDLLSTNNARWEHTEHGWRAVVTDVEGSTQLTAFVQYIDAPYWRIWAGRLFDSLGEAQTWCLDEIATRLHEAQIDAPRKPWHAEPPAWRWLWESLETRLGLEETIRLRDGLAERLRNGS